MSEEPEVIAKLRYLHGGKVDWLTTECTTTGVTISAILAAYDGILARLAASERDTERLNVLADEPIFEEFGYTDLNIYAVSSIIAKENGRDKPNKDDQRQALRHLMDASSAKPWSPDDE